MSENHHLISIWFFIGALLLVYGLLIVGAEIYGIFVPPEREVIMGDLHAGLWWGLLLMVLGGIYCYKFAPGK